MILKIYNFLENYSDLNKKSFKYYLIGIIRFVFNPVIILLEYLCYRKLWVKSALVEFITKDKIYNFLDTNEFAYRNGRFIKKDIIPKDNEYYASISDSKEISKKINIEHTEILINLIQTECSIDYENYITLFSDVTQDENQNVIYTIYIQFIRYYNLKQALVQFGFWLCFILLCIIYLFFMR